MFALRLVRIPTVALALLSLAALLQALLGHPWSLSAGRVDLGPVGTADVGLRLGVVESLLLVLVGGIGTVVAVYSRRNLVGQRRLSRYAALELGTIIGLALAVSASSLPLLAVGWTTATVTLSALVAHSGTRQARAAARQVRARLLVGDALLWVAVLVTGMSVGTLDRTALAGAVATAPPLAVTFAALLVVGAGVVRSALLPAHRWLPETAEAPSPVSALLHAGLVNGVGVLALLLWPLVQAALAARLLLFTVGAATAAVATAQLRTRADVKGRLAASTSGQMGYLAVQAALGVPAAVLAHVIGHGVWKAALFLGAGGAVDRARHRDTARPRRLTLSWVAGTGVVAALVVGGAAAVPLPTWPVLGAPAELLPLGVATAVSWLALATVARRGEGRPARLLAAGVVLALAAAYVVGLRALSHLAAPDLGEPAAWGTGPGLAAAAAVMLVFALGLLGAAIDRAARAGRRPTLARRAAVASLRPWTLRERLSPAPSVAVAVPPVTGEDAAEARQAVAVAAQTGGALYPLTAFVASNPLAGLEQLAFEDATRLAVEVWGARPGPSAAALRQAMTAGQVRPIDIEAVLDRSPTRHRTLVRALLMDDSASPAALAWASNALSQNGVAPTRVMRTPLQALPAVAESIDERARGVAHHCCTRSLAAPTWPGSSGPWQELRAHATQLDAMLHLRGAGAVVAALPAEPVAAVAALLEQLGLDPRDRPALLARLLARDPGWPAHLAWRARQARLGRDAGVTPSPDADAAPRLLEELVATRLALEVVAAQGHAPRLLGRPLNGADLVASTPDEGLARLLAAAAAHRSTGAGLTPHDVSELVGVLAPLASGGLAQLRGEVLEHAYRRDLVAQVGGRAAGMAARSQQGRLAARTAPRAQLVTCIDVRSERLRRHLEDVGRWETFGAAGFFGLPLRHVSVDGLVSERSPALLRPGVTVTEQPWPTRGVAGSTAALSSAVRTLEAAPGLPFGWAEAAGWMQAPVVLLSTVLPRLTSRLRDRSARRFGAPNTGVLHVVEDVELPRLVSAAAGFLSSMGVTELAPLVVLAGHGSRVTNNPHVAAYDCGACGGSAGDVNARTMALALNDPRVRSALRVEGVRIPDSTWFVAALHDTTRDVVDMLDLDDVPDGLGEELARLESDLQTAADHARKERLALLPDTRPARDHRRLRRQAESRAADWAQPRPEWGLAGAAAIVVGPRDLTTGLPLDGRVFLQSYQPEHDRDGTVLEQLLAAPVVVAQWITAQYWASTIDPHHFGAGDKTTHNVVGDGSALSAVLTGPRGDLRIGLPWQAVSPTAPEHLHAVRQDPWRAPTRHVPVRLLTVVYADTAVVDDILARHPDVASLVAGGWITLCVAEPSRGRVLRRTRDGAWLDERDLLVAAQRDESAGDAA